MADRYPEQERYGRNGGGRYGREERWGEDEDWRGRRERGGRGARFRESEDFDDERFGGEDYQGQGMGGYGGGYGQGMSGQTYGGGYGSRGDWERDYGRQGAFEPAPAVEDHGRDAGPDAERPLVIALERDHGDTVPDATRLRKLRPP